MSQIRSNPPPTPREGVFGFLAVCGVALEWKHGIPAFVEAFENCSSWHDVIVTLREMPDATFLGLFVWGGLLLGAVAAVLSILLLLVRRLACTWRRQPVGKLLNGKRWAGKKVVS